MCLLKLHITQYISRLPLALWLQFSGMQLSLCFSVFLENRNVNVIGFFSVRFLHNRNESVHLTFIPLVLHTVYFVKSDQAILELIVLIFIYDLCVQQLRVY